MGEPLLHGGGARAGMWWGMRQDPHSLGGRAFLRDTRSAADSERPPRCSMFQQASCHIGSAFHPRSGYSRTQKILPHVSHTRLQIVPYTAAIEALS